MTHQRKGRSRGVGVAALAVALIAGGLAGWSLLRQENAGTAAPATEQQISDGKARACSASNTVVAAVALQTHADLGGDPVAVQAVAANARLAMAAGGPFLIAHLDPATPPPVAGAIRSFADNLQEIAMNTLAGARNDDPAQAVRLSEAQTAGTQIANLCSK
jgi:hypothetical protein